MIFLSLAIGGCLLDLWTKHIVFAQFYRPGPDGMPLPGNEWWIWKDVLGIEVALNHGALFGMGQGMSGWFALLSVVAAAGIVYWLFVAKTARDVFLTVALGLITGGILGNLFDRLGLWNAEGQTIYAVRDWILIAYGGYDIPRLGRRWPNFNIADSLLVCGAIMLIWQAIFAKSDEKPPANSEKTTAAAETKRSKKKASAAKQN